MAVPAIIWRNPKLSSRRRLWNKARADEKSSLYIVVRSGYSENEWEGLPNLEMIEGGHADAWVDHARNGQSGAQPGA